MIRRARRDHSRSARGVVRARTLIEIDGSPARNDAALRFVSAGRVRTVVVLDRDAAALEAAADMRGAARDRA